MTKNKPAGTPTPCQPWCNPSKHLLCGGPLCCGHLYEKPRPARKTRTKLFSRSGW